MTPIDIGGRVGLTIRERLLWKGANRRVSVQVASVPWIEARDALALPRIVWDMPMAELLEER